MGCHTWVFKKTRELSLEEQQTIIKDTLDSISEIPPYEEWIESPVGRMAEENSRHGWGTAENQYEDLKILNKELRESLMNAKSLSDLVPSAFYHLRLESIGIESGHMGATYKIVGSCFYEHTDFDYPFRVYGYPEDSFTDVYKLLEWLKNYDEKAPGSIGYYDDDCNFIEGYSKDLENKILQYVEKEGVDDLYFEFG